LLQASRIVKQSAIGILLTYQWPGITQGSTVIYYVHSRADDRTEPTSYGATPGLPVRVHRLRRLGSPIKNTGWSAGVHLRSLTLVRAMRTIQSSYFPVAASGLSSL